MTWSEFNEAPGKRYELSVQYPPSAQLTHFMQHYEIAKANHPGQLHVFADIERFAWLKVLDGPELVVEPAPELGNIIVIGCVR